MGAGSWYRVDPVDVPAEGRVRSVTVDGRTVALARCGAGLGALENRCPHQGGPLGEGSIENGWLRCPWHGYDYDPLTGRPPEGFSDGATAYEVDERPDGVHVRLPALAPRVRTVAGRPVVAVTGDGGFGQYAAELTTAVKYGIGVKHVLLDNHSLGKISKEQLAAGFPVWHTSLHNPDWAAHAGLCGATGITASCRDQLEGAMNRLFAVDGPALLHVSQDPELL